jgi:hypothetical protein
MAMGKNVMAMCPNNSSVYPSERPFEIIKSVSLNNWNVNRNVTKKIVLTVNGIMKFDAK